MDPRSETKIDEDDNGERLIMLAKTRDMEDPAAATVTFWATFRPGPHASRIHAHTGEARHIEALVAQQRDITLTALQESRDEVAALIQDRDEYRTKYDHALAYIRENGLSVADLYKRMMNGPDKPGPIVG